MMTTNTPVDPKRLAELEALARQLGCDRDEKRWEGRLRTVVRKKRPNGEAV
jgi:hypothetical protein